MNDVWRGIEFLTAEVVSLDWMVQFHIHIAVSGKVSHVLYLSVLLIIISTEILSLLKNLNGLAIFSSRFFDCDMIYLSEKDMRRL